MNQIVLNPASPEPCGHGLRLSATVVAPGGLSHRLIYEVPADCAPALAASAEPFVFCLALRPFFVLKAVSD